MTVSSTSGYTVDHPVAHQIIAALIDRRWIVAELNGIDNAFTLNAVDELNCLDPFTRRPPLLETLIV